MANVRADAIATVIHANCTKLGSPRAARIIPRYANGSAKIVCSNLIASRKTATLFRLAVGGGTLTAVIAGPSSAREHALDHYFV